MAEITTREGSPMFGFPVAHYHRWFAWYPVDTYDQGWKWLRFVRRRRIQKHWYLDGGAMQWWQYAAAKNPPPAM
jgi:hypothetical protein